MKFFSTRAHFLQLVAVVFVLGISCASYLLMPTHTSALGDETTGECTSKCAQDKVDYKEKWLPYCLKETCTDSTGTSGHCTAKMICHGEKSGDGASLKSIGDLLKGIGDMMQAMKGSPAAGTPATAATSACPNGTYTVTMPSTDPCATYQASAATIAASQVPSSITGSGSDLASLLGLGGAGSALTNAMGGISNTSDPSVSSGGMNVLPTASSTEQAPIQPQGNGIHGDIKVDLDGATAFASNQDQLDNQTVAAFYGIEGMNVDPNAVAVRMCLTRPWVTNFLASIAPPAFFDGLCNLHGLNVTTAIRASASSNAGPPSMSVDAASVSKASQVSKAHTIVATTTATTTPVGYTGPDVPPQVQIWAVPTTVSSGSRSSLFWNTQGVYNCKITNPDGSFSQNTLSGGAATLALTADTTYTISCLKPDNTPDTAYTTIKIAP
jgi:hypothetical protein